ncbi:MAG: hypothetical protein VKK80_17460 [Prochlorothrix sp.]|nr:hypothetical protein [Prochlorothrix sp.]
MGDNFTVSSQASRLLGMARSVEFFGRSPFWPIAFLADRLEIAQTCPKGIERSGD